MGGVHSHVMPDARLGDAQPLEFGDEHSGDICLGDLLLDGMDSSIEEHRCVLPHDGMQVALAVNANQTAVVVDEAAAGVAVVVLTGFRRQVVQEQIVQILRIRGEQGFLTLLHLLVKGPDDAFQQVLIAVAGAVNVNFVCDSGAHFFFLLLLVLSLVAYFRRLLSKQAINRLRVPGQVLPVSCVHCSPGFSSRFQQNHT